MKTCPYCKEEIQEQARKCRFCGEWLDKEFAALYREPDVGDDAGMRLLLPVGRSAWAIAAGYLGLVSVLVIPAPFALITGIMAIREMRRNPKVHGMGRAIFGIVMGGIFTVLLIFVAAGLMFESWNKRR